MKFSWENIDSTIFTLSGLVSPPGTTFSTSELGREHVLSRKAFTSSVSFSIDSMVQELGNCDTEETSSVGVGFVVVFSVDGDIVVLVVVSATVGADTDVEEIVDS